MIGTGAVVAFFATGRAGTPEQPVRTVAEPRVVDPPLAPPAPNPTPIAVAAPVPAVVTPAPLAPAPVKKPAQARPAPPDELPTPARPDAAGWLAVEQRIAPWFPADVRTKARVLLSDYCILRDAVVMDGARLTADRLRDGGSPTETTDEEQEGLNEGLRINSDLHRELKKLPGSTFNRKAMKELRETPEWLAVCPDYREYAAPKPVAE